MKKIYPILIASAVIMGAFVLFKNHEAIADVLGIRPIQNSPSTNATTTLAATNLQPIGSSTVSVLRYPLNGATTTLPTASTTAESNQNGINVADAHSITLAYQTVGSSTPYAARFHIEYGYDIPLGTNPNRTSIEWFSYNDFAGGLLAEKDIYGATASTTQKSSDTLLATSTPYIYRYGLGTATTSEILNLPTYNAKYMRVHATPLGSQAMFWLNAIIRDYRR